jgi:HEPN domain-containing protein
MVNSEAAKFKEQKEKYVTEIFIYTGDEDYITARWLFLNKLFRQFFWHAAQSLEKYLKAALLLNGYPVKTYNHNIIDLFAKANSFAGDLIPENLEVPKQVKLFSTHENLWGNSSTAEFVSRIYEHGNPSNRYDCFGIEIKAADLYKLDQVVFESPRVLWRLFGLS